MFKKTALFGAVTASAMLLSACSGNGEYDKLMTSADKAMEEFKVDEAIEIYESVLDLDFSEVPYGSSRQIILEQLLNNAYSLQSEFEYLSEVSGNALNVDKNIDFDKSSLSEVVEAYSIISNAKYALEDYATFPNYTEIVELNQKYEKGIEEKVLPRIFGEVDGLIAEYRFDEASTILSELLEFGYLQEAFDLESKISALEEKIESEEKRFLVYPRTYTKHEKVLFEDSNVGKITFLGDGTVDDQKKLYFKVEGDLKLYAYHLEADLRAIFEDGTSSSAGNRTVNQYGDYAVIEYEVNNDTKLRRLDYMFDVANMTEYKTLLVEDVTETSTIPAILKVEEDKKYTTDYVVENEQMKMKFNSIKIGQSSVTFHATVEAKKDFKMEREGIYVGFTQQGLTYNYSYINDEFFMGIPRDIEVEVDLDYYITENTKYLRVLFMGNLFMIDVKTGEIIKPEKDYLVSSIYINPSSTLNISIGRRSDGTLVSDVAGKNYINAWRLYNNYRVEEPMLYIPISKNYKKFSAEIGLDTQWGGAEYGSSVLTISGDGKELQKISIQPGHTTVPIELDITNVDRLQFTLEQIEGTEDFQRIIIGNGIFTN